MEVKGLVDWPTFLKSEIPVFAFIYFVAACFWVLVFACTQQQVARLVHFRVQDEGEVLQVCPKIQKRNHAVFPLYCVVAAFSFASSNLLEHNCWQGPSSARQTDKIVLQVSSDMCYHEYKSGAVV